MRATVERNLPGPERTFEEAPATPMRIAYIFTELPSVAGMFPNAEMDAMAARGIAIEIFVLRGRPAVTGEAKRIEATYPTHRSPYLLSPALLGESCLAILRHPLLVAGVVVRTIAETIRSPRVLLKSLAVLPKTIRFAALARRRRMTLLHAYWAHLPAFAAEVMSRLSGIEFTTWAHAGGDIYQRTFQTEAALRARMRAARLVFTCNRANLDYFQTLVEPEVLSRVRLLTHGIDLEQFHPTAGKAPAARPVILAVGGFAPAKGHRYLIEACRLLEREGRPFECRLAGTGRLEEQIRRQVHKAGIEERIRFLGQVPHERLPALYREADIFVMPSVIGPAGSRDGLPNVLLEAMASGVASIGSRIASIPEAIEDGRTGLLVPPGDPGALAAAIRRLLQDESLRRSLGAAAVERVTSRFARGPAMQALYTTFCSIHRESRIGAAG
jgi:glycosyltransferase involved in cell wall biosynthesis